ncbi:MAG TPA: acyl-CoA dehydrogenase family protein [Ilumatobacter sp.]
MQAIEAFRAEATAFLEAHAARKSRTRAAGWGEGDDAIGLLDSHPDRTTEAEHLERSRVWRRLVFDSGFGWLGGPTAYGGAGRDPALDEEYRLLERQYLVPDQQPFATATHLVAPAILDCGSEDVKRRHLRPMFRGDAVACQLLSEPDAGSDLASLRTSAVRDGDGWIVNGQKVWTSQAHLADVGQLLARTDPEAPKHEGITMFLVDMHAPGVTVRPLRQMTGETHFNEVFLEEVRVPDADRVGEQGAGWRAVMATLLAERAAVGSGATNSSVDPVARLVDLAAHTGRNRDPRVRQQLAEVHTLGELRRFVTLRQQAARESGRPPGAEGSIPKLLFARQTHACGELAGDLLGPSLTADSGGWGTFAWARWVCGAPMMRIAGGTDEVQRNVLAERALGLPREPKP